MSDLQYFTQLTSQLSLPMEIIFLPTYIPNKREVRDPILYAENVRKVMCAAHNLIGKQKGWAPMVLTNERYERYFSKRSSGIDEHVSPEW